MKKKLYCLCGHLKSKHRAWKPCYVTYIRCKEEYCMCIQFREACSNKSKITKLICFQSKKHEGKHKVIIATIHTTIEW